MKHFSTQIPSITNIYRNITLQKKIKKNKLNIKKGENTFY